MTHKDAHPSQALLPTREQKEASQFVSSIWDEVIFRNGREDFLNSVVPMIMEREKTRVRSSQGDKLIEIAKLGAAMWDNLQAMYDARDAPDYDGASWPRDVFESQVDQIVELSKQALSAVPSPSNKSDVGLKCLHCDGYGYTVESRHGVSGEPEPYQEPCAECETTGKAPSPVMSANELLDKISNLDCKRLDNGEVDWDDAFEKQSIIIEQRDTALRQQWEGEMTKYEIVQQENGLFAVKQFYRFSKRPDMSMFRIVHTCDSKCDAEYWAEHQAGELIDPEIIINDR